MRHSRIDKYSNGKLVSSTDRYTDINNGVTIINETKSDNRSRWQKFRDKGKKVYSSASSILGWVFFLLFAICVIRIVTSYGGVSPFTSLYTALNNPNVEFNDLLSIMGEPIAGISTFDSLLLKMQSAPQITLDLAGFVNVLSITGDWGILDGLRVFINSIGAVLGFVGWLISCLVNVLIFVTYFLGWVFAG